jgi:3D (Asp-Asp-Asp) domain-containing protein
MLPPAPTGGAPIGGLVPTPRHKRRIPPPPSKRAKGIWMKHVLITEYWPAPESWFVGAPVKAPGLAGLHRVDWLYSASGLSMEGDGIGLDGRMYRIDALGDGGWVTRNGTPTSAGNGFSAGAPYWRAGGYWQGRGGVVTFPLLAGGWSAGVGRRYVALRGVTFAAGGTSRLHFWRSLAVDPDVIPLGSRVYIPAYRQDGYGGWFVARDTGGAITGAHVDVYRSPPRSASAGGQELTGQRVFVIRSRR